MAGQAALSISHGLLWTHLKSHLIMPLPPRKGPMGPQPLLMFWEQGSTSGRLKIKWELINADLKYPFLKWLSGSVRHKSAFSKFRETNFTVIILIGEVPGGTVSSPLHPSWDTEGICLMVAELNRLWQVIRQKTLKQVFHISWTSGNMVKLELGAGGLSFMMQMNSLIKSFQILQRSSSPCRL